jgi:hypothetical protein
LELHTPAPSTCLTIDLNSGSCSLTPTNLSQSAPAQRAAAPPPQKACRHYQPMRPGPRAWPSRRHAWRTWDDPREPDTDPSSPADSWRDCASNEKLIEVGAAPGAGRARAQVL